MTLIEIVAGLALLTTLLVSILDIKAHLGRQMRQTERRRSAVAAADGLLAQWWQNPRTLPRSATGVTTAPSGETFAWRTAIVPGQFSPPAPTSIVSPTLGQVVRLTVDADVSVDVLLPLPHSSGATP